MRVGALLTCLLLATCGAGDDYVPASGDIVFHTSRSAQSVAIQKATASPYSHMSESRSARFSRWARAALALLLGAAGCVVPSAARAEDETPLDTVVLLHGLLRTERSMRRLETHLTAAGYVVENLGYPSRAATPEELVERLHLELRACCEAAARIHFVTHSLGGILLRAYLAKHELPRLGRVVMLAPPNHGSEHVTRFGGWKLFRWVFGPTGVQLGTEPDSLPNRLPPVTFELGVIAGSTGINPLGALVLPDGNDGTVTLASTQVEGMRDFVAIPASHTFIMNSDLAIELTLEFLRSGRFAESRSVP